MPQDDRGITKSVMDSNDNNNNPPDPAPAPAPAVPITNEVALQLTQALNEMRKEMFCFRQANTQPNNNKNDDNNDRPANELIKVVRNNPTGYYPDLDKVCRHIYLDLTDIMDTKNVKYWLRSLETLVRIMRCSWILQEPPGKT